MGSRAGSAWQAALCLDQIRLEWHLELYRTLAGPGHITPVKPGYCQGLWQCFEVTHGLPALALTAITEDKEGALWMATLEGGVCRWDGQQVYAYTAQDGLGSTDVYSLLVDTAGALWLGSEGGLCRWAGETIDYLPVEMVCPRDG